MAKVQGTKGKVQSKFKVGVRTFNLLCPLYFVLCTCPAAAQPIGRVELSGGPIWFGATPFGSSDATLTAPSGDRFRLFSTSSELLRGTGLDVRVGSRVRRLVQAEVSASVATPLWSTAIGSDVEGGAPTIATDRITQVTVEGAGVVHLRVAALGPRLLPFVSAGAGYLRQLHEGATLAQTGRMYHLGGGAKVVLLSREGHWLKQVGARVDFRAEVRRGGVALDGRAHAAPALTAGIFGRFW